MRRIGERLGIALYEIKGLMPSRHAQLAGAWMGTGVYINYNY